MELLAAALLAALVAVVGVALVVPVLVRRALVARGSADAGEAELRSQAVDVQFDAVHAELRRVTDAVAGWRREGARHQGELAAGLAEAARSTAALATTAGQLRDALANPTARGRWGERMADDVLRLAGLVEGVSYHRQHRLPNGSVPDVTFLLPGGRQLHMDVKFPVANYLRAVDAATPAERRAAESAFSRDVRARIGEITGRGYADRETTLGYVLLFVPNEAVYGFMHEHDPELVDLALSQRVVLCSPFTLFAVLAVVRHAAESAALAQTSDEVLACLAGFADQWDRFVAQVEVVGKRLDGAHRAFDDLAGPRRRALQKQLDAVADLRDGAPAGAESPPRVRKVAG